MRVPKTLALVAATGSILTALNCHPCVPPDTTRRAPERDVLCQTFPETDCPPLEPRCSSDDADCGPVPLQQFTGCYRPNAERIPVTPQPNSRHQRAFPENAVCSHDGECIVVQCGSVCQNYRFPDSPFKLCEDTLRSSSLLCGCVRGRCVVFEQ